MELVWEDIINYSRMRFQIEFNFCDAKQHWGLEDFMVIEKQAVFNAANLSLWMVNLSHAILEKSEEKSILDLKKSLSRNLLCQENIKNTSEKHHND